MAMSSISGSITSCSYFIHSSETSSSEDEALEAINRLRHPSLAGTSAQKETFKTAVRLINLSSHATKNMIHLIRTMLDVPSLECRAIWQAIVRLDPLIENKQALSEAAASLYLTKTEPCSTEMAQETLWFAAYTGNEDFGRIAMRRGAQINTQIYPGMSALLLACKRGHDAFACFLLDQGASAHFIGGTHHHETPLSEALFRPGKMTRSIPRLEELDNGFSQEFHARKLLAHEHSVTTESSDSHLEGARFYLEGYRIRYILDHYLSQSRSFFEALKTELEIGQGPFYRKVTALIPLEHQTSLANDPKMRAELSSAIDDMRHSLKDYLDLEIGGLHENPDVMTQLAIQRLDTGKPVVCFGLTRLTGNWITGAPNTHAWGLVIARDVKTSRKQYIVKRCNRNGTPHFHGIITTYMSRKKVHALIEMYHHDAHWKEVFLNSDTNRFSSIETRIKAKVFQHTLQKGQVIGNCCYYSTQSIVLALLQILFAPAVNENVSFANALAKSVKKNCTSHLRSKGLRDYLRKHYGPAASPKKIHLPEQRLLIEIFKKTSRNPQLYSYHKAFSGPVLDLLKIERANAELEKIWDARLRQALGFESGTGPKGNQGIREWLNDPENTQRIQQVATLDLSNLKVENVPPEIGRFIGVKLLNLSNNHIESLPNEIGCLKALENLRLAANPLTSLPDSICRLNALSALDLSQTQVTSLALEVSKLSSPCNVAFCQNKLTLLAPGMIKPSPEQTHRYLFLSTPILFLPRKTRSYWINSETFSNFYETFTAYPCKTPLARLLQHMGTHTDLTIIKDAFFKIPKPMQQKIASKLQDTLAGAISSSSSSSSSSSASAPMIHSSSLFTDLCLLAQTLEQCVHSTFSSLSKDQKFAIYYHMCRSQGMPEDLNWALNEAAENDLCFFEAFETVLYRNFR